MSTSPASALCHWNLGDRGEFWHQLFERIERLTNRLDDNTRNKIIEAVLARVRMPTHEEIREHFERRAVVWEMLHVQTTATVDENKVVRAAADQAIAAAEPMTAIAANELKRIEQQRARMDRGEGLPPLGWIPSPKDFGISAAHASHMINLARLSPEQFERFLHFGWRPSHVRRRDYARLRRFLRAEGKRV